MSTAQIRVGEIKWEGKTSFDFVNLDGWDDFEIVGNILEQQLEAKKIDSLEGPYSRFWIYDLDGLIFKLHGDQDYGTDMYLVEQNDSDNAKLKELAELVITYLAKGNLTIG